MTNICVICGSEFEPLRNLGKRHKCCCYACSMELKRRTISEARKNVSEEYRKTQHRKFLESHQPVCKICGKSMNKNYSMAIRRVTSSHMHEKCVFSDCIETLNKHIRLSHAQQQRLYARGYQICEFKQETFNPDTGLYELKDYMFERSAV